MPGFPSSSYFSVKVKTDEKLQESCAFLPFCDNSHFFWVFAIKMNYIKTESSTETQQTQQHGINQNHPLQQNHSETQSFTQTAPLRI